MAEIYRFRLLSLSCAKNKDFIRADLEFYGVNNFRPSYYAIMLTIPVLPMLLVLLSLVIPPVMVLKDIVKCQNILDVLMIDPPIH